MNARSWVQYQRYLYHHKEIADERKAALDELGFEWSILKPKSGGKKATWDEQLARVAAYKEKHGNSLIPYSYQADPSLGFWVSKQVRRRRYESPGNALTLSHAYPLPNTHFSLL